MAFTLKTPETFTVENVPVTEAGKAEPGTMCVEFKYRTQKQHDEWFKTVREKNYIDVVPEFVVGWSQCLDADGVEIPFSVEAVRQITDVVKAFPADLFAAYQKGLFESRVKN